MYETGSMDGANWLQHQLRVVPAMLETAESPRQHLAGSLQQLHSSYRRAVWSSFVYFAKFPLWISGTNSQSNTGLKPYSLSHSTSPNRINSISKICQIWPLLNTSTTHSSHPILLTWTTIVTVLPFSVTHPSLTQSILYRAKLSYKNETVS